MKLTGTAFWAVPVVVPDLFEFKQDTNRQSVPAVPDVVPVR